RAGGAGTHRAARPRRHRVHPARRRRRLPQVPRANRRDHLWARPIELLLQIVAGEDLESELIADTRSGDLTGDFEHCVSYAALAFRDAGRLSTDDCRQLFALAWSAVRGAVLGTTPPPLPHGPALARARGVFVTLRRHGDLRGCVGQLE